jgi:hypothetical protein
MIGGKGGGRGSRKSLPQPKVKTQNNKGGAIIGKVAGLAAKGLGKGVLKLGKMAVKGTVKGVGKVGKMAVKGTVKGVGKVGKMAIKGTAKGLGKGAFKVGKMAIKGTAKGIRTIGKKTAKSIGKSFRNSYAKQDGYMRSFKQKNKVNSNENVRITQNKRNNVSNNRNNVSNNRNNDTRNSPYEASYNNQTKSYLCNPRKLEVILPNDAPSSIIAKIKNVYYNIPIPNGTAPGSTITFNQPTPPVPNVGQNTPYCHTKENPSIVNHIPGSNASSKSTFNFKSIKDKLRQGLSSIPKEMNIESLKGKVKDTVKKGILHVAKFNPNTVKKGISFAENAARASGIKPNKTLGSIGKMVAPSIMRRLQNPNTVNNVMSMGMSMGKKIANRHGFNYKHLRNTVSRVSK